MLGRVLVVAGSDSSGGAGIQADIKTITALDCYAMTAITALTAQNTRGVHGVFPVPPDFVTQQMTAALSDIGADVVKVGMLHDEGVLNAVCDVLQGMRRRPPVVTDPVMIAKGGARLIDENAISTIKRRLMLLTTIVTPNIPEAEVLSGMQITDESTMRHAAEVLLTLGVPAVLLKGGHLPGPEVVDLLVTENGVQTYRAPRINTKHTHGTGCTLSSAIAAGLAQDLELRDAVERARAYVRAAIELAPGLGGGQGPLNHSITVDETRVATLGV